MADDDAPTVEDRLWRVQRRVLALAEIEPYDEEHP